MYKISTIAYEMYNIRPVALIELIDKIFMGACVKEYQVIGGTIEMPALCAQARKARQVPVACLVQNWPMYNAGVSV